MIRKNIMQIVQAKGNIVEKIIRDKDGRLVRAQFYVYENAGRMKARLLDIEYIQTLKNTVFNLPGFIKEKTARIVNSFDKLFQSPQFTLETIYTNGSKPRAPTFI